MTRNEKSFLKSLERRQRKTKRDLRRIESFLNAHPGFIRADKARKMRLRKNYETLLLREVIAKFHKEINEPREDRYVHVNTYRRLLKEVEALRKAVKEPVLTGV